MFTSRRRAALARAARSVVGRITCVCEQLEQRRLLAANDPVLVLIEPTQEIGDIHTIDLVAPHLWQSPAETLWDPHDFANQPPPWDGFDRDGNGYADDAYGWNFASNSPNFISPTDGHGRFVTESAVGVLNMAGAQAARVKIMYVIGGVGLTANSGVNSAPLQYILDRKAHGVNIVAIGTLKSAADRAGAEALNDASIMLIGGDSNVDTSADGSPGVTSSAFYSATPRSGVQAPALDNVMPITTDPAVKPTEYGINSFYAAPPGGSSMQSFAGPTAAAMAAVAVEAYQDQHDGANPTVQQIKAAMMSGVDYIGGLDGRTITHDYVNGVRQDGGLLNQDKIIAAINRPTDEVIGVSMSVDHQDPLGPHVYFNVHGQGSVSNFTINWGDNSPSSVIDGDIGASLVEHPFPLSNIPHQYFPSIYAMSDTKQVYLTAPAAQADVTVPGSDDFAPTSGEDDYTVSLDGSGNTVLTLTRPGGFSLSQSFEPNTLHGLMIDLGAGGDMLTVDFSNGDPIGSTALTVIGDPAAGDLVRVLGSAGADSVVTTSGVYVTVNGSQFTMAGGTGHRAAY